MNTDHLIHCLQSHSSSKQTFRGVYPADHFPDILAPLPGSCVLNTHPAGMPGEHWLAFFQTKDSEIEFFDSFGKPLSFYSLETTKKVVSQSLQFQSTLSVSCGMFCVYFICMRSLGHSFVSIINRFSDNTETNEEMVAEFMHDNFQI